MTQPQHCVIVDDVRAYRLQISSWLRELGFECTGVAGAREAWDLLCSQPTNLVVTDIDMPHISGFQLIRAIRTSEIAALESIPIIAASGLCDPDVGRFVQQIGASRFVAKPLDKETFLSAAQTVVGDAINSDTSGSDTTGSGKPGRSDEFDYSTSSLDRDFPKISPVLRRLAREAIEHPTADLLRIPSTKPTHRQP
ncbi:MAG: response regulator [Pirellulaceae bacterium]|nr:response regulator [Pirellulaceae bacterium]